MLQLARNQRAVVSNYMSHSFACDHVRSGHVQNALDVRILVLHTVVAIEPSSEYTGSTKT